MKNKRKAISQKLRFEVFKRDSFKCQYCGHSAPDALLQVDHINPVKRGGKNDIINLITSCAKCNMGKGATPLDDNTAMAKSKKQMDELNERRQQLEMMVKWKNGLQDMTDSALSAICDIFTKYNCPLKNESISEIKSLLRRFSFDELYDAAIISIDTYGLPPNSEYNNYYYVKRVVGKIGGICFVRRKTAEDPNYVHCHHVKNILTKRKVDFHWPFVLRDLQNGFNHGIPAWLMIDWANGCDDGDELSNVIYENIERRKVSENGSK